MRLLIYFKNIEGVSAATSVATHVFRCSLLTMKITVRYAYAHNIFLRKLIYYLYILQKLISEKAVEALAKKYSTKYEFGSVFEIMCKCHLADSNFIAIKNISIRDQLI